jgi:uncharacterized glyoxalase superfamily protein PhnB
MATARRPQVVCDSVNPGLAVAEVRTAVEFYITRLGFEPGFTWGDPPSIAGVDLGEVRIFLSEGTPEPRGCRLNFVVDDADTLYEFQRDNGVEVVYEPGDREWGMREYAVADLHGYHLSFGHYIYSTGEPVEIERVDVPVRLERRLAGLLADLAEHKKMTVDEALEEILLHTSEPLENFRGVASPHTRTTLRYIQELKRKHGIDYDTHAGYRFVEKGA